MMSVCHAVDMRRAAADGAYRGRCVRLLLGRRLLAARQPVVVVGLHVRRVFGGGTGADRAIPPVRVERRGVGHGAGGAGNRRRATVRVRRLVSAEWRRIHWRIQEIRAVEGVAVEVGVVGGAGGGATEAGTVP